MSSRSWQLACTGGATKRSGRPTRRSSPDLNVHWRAHHAPREVYQTPDPRRSTRRHEEDHRAPRDSGADDLPTQSDGAGLSAVTRAISRRRLRLQRRSRQRRKAIITSIRQAYPIVSNRCNPTNMSRLIAGSARQRIGKNIEFAQFVLNAEAEIRED
ncbi:unnamed protein product [Phytophthora fragariaefolia]|uniref:Unnamed protein product n=1 Tax=Phytophthora fragariaefolia TaxID=1490495 RepID=A0A9W6TQG4_9STRA|nr:unnamed protein product [Phytophthora fragariaefolia]